MSLTPWGFSFKRADLHSPRREGGTAQSLEKKRGPRGGVEILEARVHAGETITVFVVGSLQAGAGLFMRLRL